MESEGNNGWVINRKYRWNQSFRVNTENDLPTQFSLLAPENTSMVTDLP